MNLPSRESLHEHRSAVQSWLAEFVSGRPGDELAWVGVPTLAAGLQNRGFDRVEPRPLDAERRASLIERSHPVAVGSWIKAGGLLALARGQNQRRALDPVLAPLEPKPVPEPDAPPELDRAAAVRALALADELVSSARRASLELPGEPIVLYRTMLRAARSMAACDAMLEAEAPRGVVIGSSHGNSARALATLARRARVPSAYVPHAPLIANIRLADLPVDLAALRGSLEIERYRAYGADRDGMIAIGNPAAPAPAETPDLRRDEPPAFALPTDDEWALERLVALAHDALGDRVIASPHPRADRERLAEMLPAGWAVWDRSTAELLLTGVPALIQASSGAGLEALQLGIPVIDLRFPGEPPNYPYLADPLIAAAGTSGELSDAVAAARGATPERREELKALAGGWVTGGDAARAGTAALEQLVSSGQREAPVWDAWGPSSAR